MSWIVGQALPESGQLRSKSPEFGRIRADVCRNGVDAGRNQSNSDTDWGQLRRTLAKLVRNSPTPISADLGPKFGQISPLTKLGPDSTNCGANLTNLARVKSSKFVPNWPVAWPQRGDDIAATWQQQQQQHDSSVPGFTQGRAGSGVARHSRPRHRQQSWRTSEATLCCTGTRSCTCRRPCPRSLSSRRGSRNTPTTTSESRRSGWSIVDPEGCRSRPKSADLFECICGPAISGKSRYRGVDERGRPARKSGPIRPHTARACTGIGAAGGAGGPVRLALSGSGASSSACGTYALPDTARSDLHKTDFCQIFGWAFGHVFPTPRPPRKQMSEYQCSWSRESHNFGIAEAQTGRRKCTYGRRQRSSARLDAQYVGATSEVPRWRSDSPSLEW